MGVVLPLVARCRIRVTRSDVISQAEYPAGEFDNWNSAVVAVDEHNSNRKSGLDDVYTAYDESGRIIRSLVDVEGC